VRKWVPIPYVFLPLVGDFVKGTEYLVRVRCSHWGDVTPYFFSTSLGHASSSDGAVGTVQWIKHLDQATSE
jgi:hypothetical protein